MEINMAENDFERDAIMNVQRYLRQLTFFDDDIGDLPIDGIWESRTRDSVMDFQRKIGLPVTGVVDRPTWDRLKAEYDASVAMNSPAVSLDLFPREPVGFELSPGDSGFLVTAVQYLLNELEGIYMLKIPPISGNYDSVTEEAVREIQKRNLIPVTGKVDRETWDAMASQHNILLRYSE